MQKIELISASGNVKQHIDNNTVKVTISRATIKITISPKDISGSQKINNDLILVKSDGDQIFLEGFFALSGKEKNKLVIEDQDELYLANYDEGTFSGLEFIPVDSLNDVIMPTGNNQTAAWLVPVVGLAAVGAGIAVYNYSHSGNQHSGSENNNSSDTNDNTEQNSLNSALETLNVRSTELDNARQALEDSVREMKTHPDDDSVGAVSDARASLESAVNSLKTALVQLQDAVTNAAGKDIDTSAAQQEVASAEDRLSGASDVMQSAAQNLAVVLELLDANPEKVLASVQETVVGALKTINEAVKQPVEENIKACMQSQTQAEQGLAELKTMIDKFSQVIEKAQNQGISVSSSLEYLSTLQTQYENTSSAVVKAVETALKNQHDLTLASEAAQAAQTAVAAAEQAKAVGEEKLSAALALKKQVLEASQIDRVEEVNQAIAEANQALETARESADVANALIQTAIDATNQVSPDVDPSLLPGNIAPVDFSDLHSIDKGLQIDTHKTFLEALQDFTQKFVDSVKDIFQQIADSGPATMIKYLISSDLFASVGDVIAGKVSAIVESFNIAFKGTLDLAGAEFKFLSTLFSTGVSAVKETISGSFSAFKDSVGAVLSGITQGISDALKDMGLLDWINPSKWISLVSDIVVKSVGNIFSNLAEVIKDTPGKVIDFVAEKISIITEATGEKVSEQFSIVKDSVFDILKTAFDAFIQQPLEKLIQPVMDKIVDLISHPFESVQGLISAIVESVNNGIDIVKNIISLPGKLLDNTAELIQDVLNAFGKDTVTDGDGNEIQGLAGTALNDMNVKPLLIDSGSNGDISLDSLVPQTKTAIQVPGENMATLTTEPYHNMTFSPEESHVQLPVAA